MHLVGFSLWIMLWCTDPWTSSSKADCVSSLKVIGIILYLVLSPLPVLPSAVLFTKPFHQITRNSICIWDFRFSCCDWDGDYGDTHCVILWECICVLEEPAASIFNEDSTFLTGYRALQCHGGSSSEFPSFYARRKVVICCSILSTALLFTCVYVFADMTRHLTVKLLLYGIIYARLGFCLPFFYCLYNFYFLCHLFVLSSMLSAEGFTWWLTIRLFITMFQDCFHCFCGFPVFFPASYSLIQC